MSTNVANEMMRPESIDGENEILHEIETYNELLGDKGELGCTLLIEIDDPVKRAELLAHWTNLTKQSTSPQPAGSGFPRDSTRGRLTTHV